MQAQHATQIDINVHFQPNESFMEFPVGLIIIDKGNTKSNYSIAFANFLARNLLAIPINNDIESFKNTLKKFRKLSSLNSLNCNLQEISLYEQIFSDCPVNEIINEKFVSLELMIYVKIRFMDHSILISIDNYDDERKTIQKNIMKSLNCKYLLTLYHEINNPLSSLINSVEDVFVEERPKKKAKLFETIKLLVSLIKIFIKNFVLTFKLEFEDTSKFISNGTFVNLEFIFTKVSSKFSQIFQNKKLSCETNFAPLSDKVVVTDYFYFKNLLKNIFIYSYHRLERESKLGIEIILTRNNEAKFCFVPKGNLLVQQSGTGSAYSPSGDLDKSFFPEIDVKKSIQTLGMVKDTIMKLAKLLGITVKILDDMVLPYFMRVHLKYQTVIQEEDNMAEFSIQTERQREEKIAKVSLSLTNPNLIHHSKCGQVCSCCENGGKQHASDDVKAGTFSNSENEKVISVTLPFQKSKESEAKNFFNEKTFKGFRYSDNELARGKVQLQSTNVFTNGMTPFTRRRLNFERNSRHKDTLSKYIPQIEDDSSQVEIKHPKVLILPIESSSSDSSRSKKDKNPQTIPAMFSTITNLTFKDISNIISDSGPDVEINKISAKSSHVEEEKDIKKKMGEIIEVKEDGFGGDIFLRSNEFRPNWQVEEIPHSPAFQELTTSNDLVYSSLSHLQESKLFSISPSEIPYHESTLNYTEELVDLNNKIVINNPQQAECFPCLNKSNAPINRRFSSNRNELTALVKQPPRRINTLREDKIPSWKCDCKDVMLVDDEEFNLTSMKNLMKKNNIFVDVALNGKLCIEKILEKKKSKCGCKRDYYKLILMDFLMPEMDGLEASMAIYKMIESGEINKDIRIVIVSAHEGEQLMQMIKKNPIIQEYIKKPVKKTKIEEIIKKFYI